MEEKITMEDLMGLTSRGRKKKSTKNRSEDADNGSKVKIKKAKIKDWYASVSAFHKELRRGDVAMSMYWAISLGAKKSFNYAKSVVLEETRSFRLLKEFASTDPDDLSLKELARLVAMFCKAVKRWEVPYAHDFNMIHLYTISKDSMPEYDNPYEWSDKDCEQMMRIYYDLRDSEDFSGQYRDGGAYCELIADEFGFGLHQTLTVAQVMGGLWSPEMDNLERDDLYEWIDKIVEEEKQKLDGKTFSIPRYAYDKHTAKGKAIYKKTFEAISHTKKPAVDLRYSGSMLSTYWRALAYQKFGTIEVDWHKPMETEEEIDLFYLAKKYSKPK